MHTYVTLTLEGDHYAMGWQHGRQVGQLRSLIVQAIEARFAQIEGDGPDPRFETLLRETRELLQDVDPPLLAMIQGQAEALGFEFDMLLRYDLVTYLRDALVTRQPPAGSVTDRPGREGCTTWAATGSAVADGQPILIKNRDYRLEHLPLQVVIHAAPESGYRYVCSGSAGSPGVFSAGINQAGLAVADTHVCSTDLGPGLPDYALMMHLLEDHDSVSSAVDYLRSVPRLGRNNLILADARGHLAVFEIGHRGYGLFEAHDGALVNTNHFLSPELRDCFVDTSPSQMQGNSFRRFEKVARELHAALGHIDVLFARRLMAAHDGPLASICRHPMAGRDSATISANIFLPALRTMLFCHGLPCQGDYDEFALLGRD
jgi:isopenicillin-N N-acyltransferase-like protein